MSGYSIHVAGLAPTTSEQTLHDFFSFCGKLTSVKKSGTEADITFEKQSAMRTALMLNGGTLDGAHLEVTSKTPEADTKAAHSESTPGAPPIDQEDKPKSAIAAEYLASGYLLGDHILQKAIDVDRRQGISSRFLSFLGDIDKKAGERLVGENQTVSARAAETAHEIATKAREADQQHGVSSRFHQYYLKALATPVGQTVSKFYHEGAATAYDIHEEAKRIANQKKAASGTNTPLSPSTPAHAGATGATGASAAPASAPVNADVEAKESAQAAGLGAAQKE